MVETTNTDWTGTGVNRLCVETVDSKANDDNKTINMSLVGVTPTTQHASRLARARTFHGDAYVSRSIAVSDCYQQYVVVVFGRCRPVVGPSTQRGPCRRTVTCCSTPATAVVPGRGSLTARVELPLKCRQPVGSVLRHPTGE